MLEKGKLLRSMGKFDQALECYNNIIEINPNLCDAHLEKGKILSFNPKDAQFAHFHLDKALDLNP